MARKGISTSTSINLTRDQALLSTATKATGATFGCYLYIPAGNAGGCLLSQGSNGSGAGLGIFLGSDQSLTMLQYGLLNANTGPSILGTGAWKPAIVTLDTSGAYRIRTQSSDITSLTNVSGYNGTNGVWFGDVPMGGGTPVGVLMSHYINNAQDSNLQGVGMACVGFWNVKLSDADVAAFLGGSTDPSTINTAHLTNYFSMIPGTAGAGGGSANADYTGEDSVNPSHRVFLDDVDVFTVSGTASNPTFSAITGVTVSPSAPSVAGLGTQQLSAVVNGTGSPSQAVTWSKVSGGGSLSSGGLYTAPAATGSAQTATIQALASDGTHSGTATITIPAVTISVSGAGGATSVTDGSTLQMSASGGTAYTWGVTGGGSSNSSGLYTPPASGSGTGVITATDSSGASGSLNVSYNPAGGTVTGVAVTPNANPDVVNGLATLQLFVVVSGSNSPSQSVNWTASGGSVNSSGLFTAPSATSVVQNLTVTATSAQDNTKSATVSIRIPAVVVSVTAAGGATSVLDGATLQCAASGGSAYIWSVTGGGSVNSSGLYAPPLSGSGTALLTATDATGAAGTLSLAYAPPVVVSIASTANCQIGATVAITPSVTGTGNTATTVSGSGAASYSGGVFSSPSGAVSGGSYTLTFTSVADPTKSASCVVTMTSLTARQVSWQAGQTGLSGVTVQADNGLTGTLAAPVTLAELVVGGVHTGIYQGSVSLNSTLRTFLLFCDGQGNYSEDYIEVPSGLTSAQTAQLAALQSLLANAPSWYTATGALVASVGFVTLPLQIGAGTDANPVTRIDWKQYQTSLQLCLTLLDANGQPLNLTGAQSVTLHLAPLLGSGSVISEAMTVLYAAGGQVGYTFTGSDVAAAGTFALEVQAVDAAGRKLYWPSDGTVTFVMHPSLGGP